MEFSSIFDYISLLIIINIHRVTVNHSSHETSYYRTQFARSVMTSSRSNWIPSHPLLAHSSNFSQTRALIPSAFLRWDALMYSYNAVISGLFHHFAAHAARIPKFHSYKQRYGDCINRVNESASRLVTAPTHTACIVHRAMHMVISRKFRVPHLICRRLWAGVLIGKPHLLVTGIAH
jgi:hypothetical protein